jgi:3'-phosphoadenosine 5'-phosphosulfate sulfotransferase (PAPS reductase)/FAD synthetase
MMEILSLGAGVQSTALLLLSVEGKLPKLDYAIFADTGWEVKDVYSHLDKLEKEVAEPAGIKVIKAKANGNIREDMMSADIKPNGAIPVYARKPNGKLGFTPRQCTRHYKVRPVEREIRKLMGAKETASGRIPQVPKVSMSDIPNLWIGISTDEFHRAKDSPKKYIKHTFPLIMEMNWSRNDCIEYIESKGFGNVVKSACVCCPFRGNNGYLEIKNNYPDEWNKLVEFDNNLRTEPKPQFVSRMNTDTYLHRSGVPLENAELIKDKESTFSCSPWTCEWEKP